MAGRGLVWWVAWGSWGLTMAAALVALTIGVAVETERTVLGGHLVGVGAMAGLGAYAATQRPTLLTGWLLLAFAFSAAAGSTGWMVGWLHLREGNLDYGVVAAILAVSFAIWSIPYGTLLLLGLTAPDGVLLSARWRLAVVGVIAMVAIWVYCAVAAMLASNEADLGVHLATNGLVDDSGLLDRYIVLLWYVDFGLMGMLLIAAVAALTMRFRRSSSGEERQRLKWVVTGLSLGFVLHLAEATEIDTQPWITLQDLAPMAAYLAMAIGFGFALLRYRLWDIDVVLRRSLIYGMLWLTIAAAYACAALVLGVAVSARVPVWLAICLTVVVTLAFQPARRHLERLADRWVFGQREPAIKVVNSFGQRLGNAQHIDDIAQQLAQAARTAIRLESVEVCIEGSCTIRAGPSIREPTATVSLVHGDEWLGRLAYEPLPGHELSEEEHATLAALCAQASTAISHAFLAARIVRAQELERRRIERNIHDGAQQELVALVAKVGLARNQNGALDHNKFLAELQGEIRAILANLRDLAQGVHPSVLVDGGLAAAIEDRCSRLSIPVNLRMAPAVRGQRLPSDIEAAAYFVVAEGLTNLLRHSGASTATVEVGLAGADLVLQVADDGCGFEPATVSRSGGLQGLADRLQAFGGSLVVDSAPGRGTLLHARLPVSVMVHR